MKSSRDSVEESRLNFLEKFESNIAFSDSQAIRQRNNLEKNKNLISFMVLQRNEDFYILSQNILCYIYVEYLIVLFRWSGPSFVWHKRCIVK